MLRVIVALLCALAAASAGRGPVPELDGDPSEGPGAGFLPFFYDLYTFRGDSGTTAVVAAFAVAAGKLAAEGREGEVRYRFDVTLVLADTAERTVVRTDDSVFVGAPRPLARDHLLYTHVEVRAPPSRSTVQRVVMTDAATPGRGQLYDSYYPVPDYSGSELMLSDIALGEPGPAAGWKRGDVTLALLPTSQFPEGSFEVYYEIYNLPHRTRYGTELVVERLGDSPTEPVAAGDAVRLRFSGESPAGPGGSVPELRYVETDLGRGRYRLTVTVTDEESGDSTSRSRLFEVRGWGPGTTMVAALPRTAGIVR
ncbi:MAG TPA: hypothetical protein VMM12_02140 [Longimicrobiales bacterium]|nr:hypothetical protein [Longimicrobiales bacterium]